MARSDDTDLPDFLARGGEAGRLIAARDWSQTSLGAIDGWPPSLRTATAIVVNSPVPIVMLWGEDGVMLYNDAYSIFAGGRHPDLLGSRVREGWPEVADFNDNVMRVGLAGGTLAYRDQELTLYRNGRAEQVWMNLDYSPVPDESGKPAGVICILAETTERVAAERRAAAERDRQQRMLQQMPGFAAMLDGPEHRFVYVNDAYRKIAGERDFIGLTVRDVFPDLAGQGFYELLDRVYAGGNAFAASAMPISLDRADGERFIDFLYEPIRDDTGQVTGIFVGGYDVTERQRSEVLRADSERRYRTLFEAMDAGFCVLELKFDEAGRAVDYRHVEINPAFERQTGLRDYLGIWVRDGLPGLEQHWFDLYGSVAQTGVPVRFENQAEPLGRWFEVHAFRTGAPEERRVAVLFNDITARRAAEEELKALNGSLEALIAARTSELRFHRDIIEATVSPICAFDHDYRLIAFNKAHNDEFRRVNGFDTKLGDVFPDLFVAEQQPVMRALMTRALTGKRFTVTEEFGRPELGQPLWEIHYAPLRDAGGSVIGAFHLATDISERLRAEADLAAAQDALRQSQKMEAMGSLTGGVAHDFNNLLTPIVGSLDLLQRKGLGGEREQRLIHGALQSAERAKTLVQRLLAFARRQPLQPEAVDVAALVTGMADLVASTSGPIVKVAIDVAPELPAALADANQVEMAILNLAVNARDAMPDGGRLTIAVAAETVADGHRASLAPGRYVRLSVADSGAGMDEETAKRAVEPFFSTKGIGKGTGLGLSMVHGLAAQLRGGLAISSRPGLGTMVELWLPASEAAAVSAERPEATPSPSRAGTVLLVDDEELVRASTADMLAELGYTVVEAGSAEEALALFDEGLDPDLLVTDHLMPGMTGIDLARQITAGRAMPTLVVSGYADVDGIATEFARLVKPFKRVELAEALAGLTAAP